MNVEQLCRIWTQPENSGIGLIDLVPKMYLSIRESLFCRIKTWSWRVVFIFAFDDLCSMQATAFPQDKFSRDFIDFSNYNLYQNWMKPTCKSFGLLFLALFEFFVLELLFLLFASFHSIYFAIWGFQFFFWELSFLIVKWVRTFFWRELERVELELFISFPFPKYPSVY